MPNSIIQKLLEPKAFDAFIQENMKISTYKADWKGEMSVEYEPSKAYQAVLAEYAAAMVGSVIDKNAEKPTHQMPTARELVGAIARMGDEWQMDNDRLDRFYYLEGRYRSRVVNFSDEQKKAEFAKLIKFLFDPFEKAVIAPHKRIDMLYFEGLFNGTQTVNANNNKASDVAYSYEFGVQRIKTQFGQWSNPYARPVDDFQYVVDLAAAKGKSVLKVRMSKKTFRQLATTNQLKDHFVVKLNGIDVSKSDVGLNHVNTYLQDKLLPTIEIEPDRFITLADGSSVNLTKDDRVVFMCATRVAILKAADPLEMVDPLPNKVYSTYDDNLVGMWRDSRGRFIDYEMWGTPVFTGRNEYFILKTDEVESTFVPPVDPNATPRILPFKTAESFECNEGASDTEVISFSTQGLTGKVKAVLSGANKALFTLGDIEMGVGGGSIEVTYTPGATAGDATHAAKLTLSAQNVTPGVEITLNGTSHDVA
ncbi:MAG: hypothetical protein PHS63_05130 [Desulfoplanes sp.]|nr:hypothetical protein [Desulfoplanes sp.]MDD4032670.1 hypothetical protein [Bacteroidales bacterium]